MNDTRNVTDEFKGRPEPEIIEVLDERGIELEIAIENLERDFNMGSIVRSANAFGIRTVHIIGRRQWNKRGAMATDKYLHVRYHAGLKDFVAEMKADGRHIVVIDNVEGAKDIRTTDIPERSVLVFGAEGPGVSSDVLGVADEIVMVAQKGSTRSLNVGAAAAIAMYEWSRRHDI